MDECVSLMNARVLKAGQSPAFLHIDSVNKLIIYSLCITQHPDGQTPQKCRSYKKGTKKDHSSTHQLLSTHSR
ncbi:hypothetical protein E6O75_ATG01587 [Venturia nashicola]|uniref:Uncharacterized protein n=1 Tax=Venturia nashicola TaxID=86259 RepID=A0A4Z1PHC4_9PEZI|nr:hypothetical protein E6O75_ATG01587 [Venturia nashicola]